ncbi:Putative winged helix-like DNA-binding domain superfamily [Septoria linicola]|uniref:Winged helix-like DNA-binding domain superfamily n=1 Tax=Septoria linicola TaxID=215465 RepID=A0A9Q9B678_9PEZI|nr:Putative winged helix-like DNA-binding domain superfamily [Septoria linicola]
MLALDTAMMQHIEPHIAPTHSDVRESPEVLELPARKRRRTTHISNSSQADAHKLCALAIAVDVDLFGHLARSGEPVITTHQLAAATGVEARLLSSIMQTLASDGWLTEVGSEDFAANKVTLAMTDPDFQSLVAHCFEMGLPAVLATPRFLSSIDFREPQDAIVMAWHVAKATHLGFFDYLNEPGT